MLTTALLACIATTTVYASSTCNTASSLISWGLCNEKEVSSISPIQCANLRVPLDYTNASSTQTLNLELARIPASIKPSKGSILLNFGGPGELSRESLGSLGPIILALSGGQYDLVTLDSRGTGNTIPFVCYPSELESQEWLLKTQNANSSNVAVGNVWAQAKVDAETCKANAGRVGELVSTAFVARDFMSVVDALGEDGMLRYWGLSYGTTLGATLASMFPEKIDKMLLDGVQNPHEYSYGTANIEEWTQSDYAFSSIFQSCVANPTNCTLSKRNQTAAQLEQATWDLLDRVKAEPIVVGTLPVTYKTLKDVFHSSLYSVASWPNTTTIIDMLLSDDPPSPTKFLPYYESVIGASGAQTAAPQSLLGIQCADRTTRLSSLKEFLPTVDALFNISKIFGDAEVNSQAVCAQWTISPKERYMGNFTAKIKGRMLLIGNTGDAHTPVVSARNVSAGFEGSEVLVVNGFGHTSAAAASSCTLEKTVAFWNNGTLPNPGTVCEVEAKPFSGIGWANVFEMVGGK